MRSSHNSEPPGTIAREARLKKVYHYLCNRSGPAGLEEAAGRRRHLPAEQGVIDGPPARSQAARGQIDWPGD